MLTRGLLPARFDVWRCLQLATGEWKLLQGLGKGAELEAKCEYRVEECLTMARVLQAMHTGEQRGRCKAVGARQQNKRSKQLCFGRTVSR